MLLNPKTGASLPSHAFPQRIRTMKLTVVWFEILQIIISCPRSANFATLKLFKIGLMGQVNDPCPSSTIATHFLTLFDFCVNGPWCWRWPLDEVWQSKAPGPPPMCLHFYCKFEGGGAYMLFHSLMIVSLPHHAFP